MPSRPSLPSFLSRRTTNSISQSPSPPLQPPPEPIYSSSQPDEEHQLVNNHIIDDDPEPSPESDPRSRLPVEGDYDDLEQIRHSSSSPSWVPNGLDDFDLPGAVRVIKPLPKRKRMSGPGEDDEAGMRVDVVFKRSGSSGGDGGSEDETENERSNDDGLDGYRRPTTNGMMTNGTSQSNHFDSSDRMSPSANGSGPLSGSMDSRFDFSLPTSQSPRTPTATGANTDTTSPPSSFGTTKNPPHPGNGAFPELPDDSNYQSDLDLAFAHWSASSAAAGYHRSVDPDPPDADEDDGSFFPTAPLDPSSSHQTNGYVDGTADMLGFGVTSNHTGNSRLPPPPPPPGPPPPPTMNTFGGLIDDDDDDHQRDANGDLPQAAQLNRIQKLLSSLAARPVAPPSPGSVPDAFSQPSMFSTSLPETNSGAGASAGTPTSAVLPPTFGTSSNNSSTSNAFRSSFFGGFAPNNNPHGSTTTARGSTSLPNSSSASGGSGSLSASSATSNDSSATTKSSFDFSKNGLSPSGISTGATTNNTASATASPSPAPKTKAPYQPAQLHVPLTPTPSTTTPATTTDTYRSRIVTAATNAAQVAAAGMGITPGSVPNLSRTNGGPVQPPTFQTPSQLQPGTVGLTPAQARVHAALPVNYYPLFSSVDGIVKNVARAAVATKGGLLGGVDFTAMKRKLGRGSNVGAFDRFESMESSRMFADDIRGPGGLGAVQNGEKERGGSDGGMVDRVTRYSSMDDRDDGDGPGFQQGGGNKKKRKVPELTTHHRRNSFDDERVDPGYADPNSRSLTRRAGREWEERMNGGDSGSNDIALADPDLDGSSDPHYPTQVGTPSATAEFHDPGYSPFSLSGSSNTRMPQTPGSMMSRFNQVFSRRARNTLAPLPLPPLTALQPNIISPTAQPTALRNPSKAAKAAKKQAREMKAERERWSTLLPQVTLPNLYDPSAPIPEPLVASTTALVKAGKNTRSESPPPTREPPQPSAEAGPLTLYRAPVQDVFTFTCAASPLVSNRLKTLSDQAEKVQAAKLRVENALKEEAAKRLARDKEGPSSPSSSFRELNDGHKPTRKIPNHQLTSNGLPRKTPASRAPPISSSAPRSTVNQPRSTGRKPSDAPVGTRAGSSEPAGAAPPKKAPAKKGKKKRSALANANNLHHRDNYVPSRLPSSSQQQGDHSDSGHATPGDPTMGASGLLGSDEWLCAFCEYKIYYGDENLLASCIKKRKKVLKIRKKAQERAAKAMAADSSQPPTGPANSPTSNKAPLPQS